MYNSPSEFMGFTEINAPGAADSILATNPDVRMLGMNHDQGHVLARTVPRTLGLTSDSRGMAFEASVRKMAYSEELVSGIVDGSIDGMSYGFAVGPEDQDWDESDPSNITRTLRSYKALYDVSPVAWEAFKATSVSVGLRSASSLTTAEVRSLIDASRGHNFTADAQVRERRRRLLVRGF